MSRSSIYYWKCDRPAVLHGTTGRPADSSAIAELAQAALSKSLASSEVTLNTFESQGNHLTWLAKIDGQTIFLRIDDGPEMDRHLEVESALTTLVGESGVRVPKVIAVDASRKEVPFAWQAIEYIDFPDLNTHFKAGRLQTEHIAPEIGAAIAKWQSIPTEGFGIFSIPASQPQGPAQAYHSNYESYYRLRLEEHLGYLTNKQFLCISEARRIERAIESHSELLKLSKGCFVHKDVALWNILGSATTVKAFIDFDDAIAGDPMDDISLLACFHSAEFVHRAVQGYKRFQPLPEEHLRRLWLHLLRNMIVKSVIRVGAGYFDCDRDVFLLAGRGGSADLKIFTKQRLLTAVSGLEANAALDIL